MRRQVVSILLMVALAASVFAGGSSEDMDSANRITVATDATWPPMEFINADQELVGFDIDLMNAIAEAAGFEVEFQNTAWDGIFAGLANGDYDAIISSVTITEERDRTMDFSTPYINAGQVLIVRQDAPSSWVELADLAGESVGAQIGTTGAIAISEVDGVDLRTYDELGLAIEDLAQDRIAGVVADTPIAADFALQNDNYSGVLQIVGDAFTEEFYGIAVTEGNEDVLAMINEGLEAVLADGTVEELMDTWLR